MDNKISIIINCYNGEKFLKSAIDSIYCQTYKAWEIIFWDNCSIDNSANIAKSYNHKLKYFKSSKKTLLGEARNLALKECKLKYVCFLDCDDEYLPNKLLHQVEMMESYNYALTCSQELLINNCGKK